MTEELDALKANDVWEIVVPPENAQVLHNKWVYKTKTDANGDIERSHGLGNGKADPGAFETLEGTGAPR
uniref:Reverse transcriptase Ty1/copia-type domain-containing protein n=1 Tax=Peronospora matthiolae TaxID=2874970 RepID=A0AAV1UJN6_9STRA